MMNVPPPQVANIPQVQMMNVPPQQVANIPQVQMMNVPPPQVANIPQVQMVNAAPVQLINSSQAQQANGPLINSTAIPYRNSLAKGNSNNSKKLINIGKGNANNSKKPINIGKGNANNKPKSPTTPNLRSPTTPNLRSPYSPHTDVYPGYTTGWGYGNPGYGYPGYSSYGYPGYSSYGYPGYSSYSYGYGYPGYSMFGYNPLLGYYGNSYSGVGLGLGLGLGANYLYGNQYSQPVTVSTEQAGIVAGPSVIRQPATTVPAFSQNPGLATVPALPQATAPAAAPAQPTIMPPPDYYAILGVPRTSTNSAIKTAYTTIKTAMAKIPTKAGTNSGNKDLEAAYATLSDATKRKVYDTEVDEWVKAHPPIPSKSNASVPKTAGMKKRQTRRRRA